MNQSRIHLSSPHMSGFEQQFINQAFDSNWIAPIGPNIDAFERELAEFVGVNGALALNSGTAAIHLALKLLNVTQGDTVFCSSLTFVASANPILYEGANPVFIDSEPESWNMSPIALEKAFIDFADKLDLPKAVIVVNLYGQSADMDEIKRICDQYNVPIIEDAAESLGATYKDKASGTIGKYGIFSFNGNKIITTSGGGMLVSNDLEGIEKARFMSSQSRDVAVHYQHSEIGYNYRMSNISAGIGRGQLKVLEDRVSARRNVFQMYSDSLSVLDGIQFMPEFVMGRSTRWLTALTVEPDICGLEPGSIINALSRLNIEARPVWKPLHLQPLFKNNKFYSHLLGGSISEIFFNNGICLPSGSNLSKNDINRIIQCIMSCLKVKSMN